MDTEEQLRARLYRMASEHPDPEKRDQARRMLDVMPKHPADTRETDFVDRVEGGPDAKAVLLDRNGAPRNVPAGNLREGQTVRRAPQNTNFGGGERAFVDQVDNGVASILDKKGHPRSIPAGDLKEGQSIEDPGEITTIPSPPPSRHQLIPQELIDKANNALPHPNEDAMRAVHKFGNEYMFGIPDVIGDLVGTDSPEARQKWEAEHPFVAGAAGAAGAFAPGSLISRGAGALSKRVNSGLRELAQSSPRVAAILGMAPRVVTDAAKGAGEASALATVRGGIEGVRGGPGGIAQGASEGASDPTNLALGAGFGVASSAAGGVRKVLRDPNIALLESYGMQPGILKPVVNEGEPFSRTSATGVDTAGPRSRQEAGLAASKTITHDLNARSDANHLELKSQRLANARNGVSSHEVPTPPMMNVIDAIKARPDLDPTSGGKLDTIRERITGASERPREIADRPTSRERYEPIAAVAARKNAELKATDPRNPYAPGSESGKVLDTLRAARDGYVRSGKPVPQELVDSIASLEPHRPPPVPEVSPSATAGDVQKIAGLSYRLARPAAAGGPDYPELFSLGKKLKGMLPREMADQDAAFHRAETGVERARDTLGIERKPDSNLRHEIPRETIEKGAQNLASSSENTKFGGNSADRMNDLREQGPPPTMRGPKTARFPRGRPARGTPPQIDYGSQIDRPAIQTAQESLQLNPSAMFSGGWTGLAKKAVGVPAKRFIYPVAKAMSKTPASRPANVVSDIVGAVKKRRKREEDQAEP